MAQAVTMIVIAIVLIVLFVWILRSRTGAANHLDTSATAVGAVAEAARNIAEEAAHKIEHVFKDEEKGADARSAVDSPVVTADQPAAEIVAELEPQPVEVAETPQAAVSVAPAVTPPATATLSNGDDNLRQLKGVGPKLAALLTQLGITRFDQIAGWSDADIARIDPQLGTFKGRIVRDNWVEQARFLAAGDVAGFEAKFGKLDGSTGK